MRSTAYFSKEALSSCGPIVKTAGTVLLVSDTHYVICLQGLTRELKLLAGHSLKCHREVEGCDRYLRHLLERHDEAFLRDSDIVDTHTSNGEIRVGFGDVIPHCFLGCQYE